MGKKLKVGILFGGRSAEHEVSIQSARNVLAALDRERFEPVPIAIDTDGTWYLDSDATALLDSTNPELKQLNSCGPSVTLTLSEGDQELVEVGGNGANLGKLDVVFPVLHGTYGEDGSVQGMLRLANLPFVGPSILGSSLCMDKDITHRVLGDAGINVAKSLVFRRIEASSIDEKSIVDSLGLPVFVKPANLGSSVGISKVTDVEGLKPAIELAFSYDRKIVIEEQIVGREIEIAVLGNQGPEASVPGEIIPTKDFYSYEAKYVDDSARLKAPAELSEEVTQRLQAIAKKAFIATGCEGMARVDFFLTESGEIYINEINTIPGFTKISMYPRLWELSGLSYTDLISRLIDLAIERHQEESALNTKRG